jgi:hypothetical protein
LIGTGIQVGDSMNKEKKIQWVMEALMISCSDERIDGLRGRGELRDGPMVVGLRKSWRRGMGEALATCGLGLVFLRWPFGWSASVPVAENRLWLRKGSVADADTVQRPQWAWAGSCEWLSVVSFLPLFPAGAPVLPEVGLGLVAPA